MFCTLASLALLAVAVFSVFGFLASGGSTDYWPWKVFYVLLFCFCLGGIPLVWKRARVAALVLLAFAVLCAAGSISLEDEGSGEALPWKVGLVVLAGAGLAGFLMMFRRRP